MGLLDRLFSRHSVDDAWKHEAEREVCGAMAYLAPADWPGIALTLEATDRGFGQGLSHSALTSEPSVDGKISDARFIMPDADFMAVTRRLELAWVAHGATFQRCVLEAVRDEEGWSARATYD